MKISVFITNPVTKALNFSKEHEKLLKNALPDVEVAVFDNPNSFKNNLKDTDIMLVWYFSPVWLKKAPNLKWIAVPSAGTDFLNLNLPEGIRFTNSTFHGQIMAETVLGAILGFSRGLFWINKHQKEAHWPKKQYEDRVSTLKGSHLVILGYGHIGNHIARLAKPFGVKITGVKRTNIKKPVFFDDLDNIITVESLDSVLTTADHLVMVLPKNESTNNIINKDRIALLPKTAYIYNIGRGNALNEEALMEALNQNKIAGAYLDVFTKEPLPEDSPLRKCTNLLITPHSSAVAPNFLNLFLKEFIEKYKKWITNKDIKK